MSCLVQKQRGIMLKTTRLTARLQGPSSYMKAMLAQGALPVRLPRTEFEFEIALLVQFDRGFAIHLIQADPADGSVGRDVCKRRPTLNPIPDGFLNCGVLQCDEVDVRLVVAS